MDLIFIRHGETDANKKKIYSTPLEPLNEEGKSTLSETAKRIKKYEFSHIETSPYIRAMETANIINESKGKKIISNDLLKELSLGDLEGHSFEEYYSKHPEKLGKWMEDPLHFAPPKGESILEGMKRARKVLHSFSDENVLFVSHEGFIKLCLCVVLEDPNAFFRFRIKNGSITIIHKEEGYFSIDGINN